MEECDLIILIYACDTLEKYKNQIITINNTWGKICENHKIKVLYFLGNGQTDFIDTENIKYINLDGVQDDYLSASYKQFLGLKYIYENYKSKFIICIGTDTYLNIPKLLLYVNTHDSNEFLYIGGHGCERQIGNETYYFHSGGPGFIITHGILEKIYHSLPTIMNDWINLCNFHKIEYLIASCDVAISYYVQQPSINAKVIKTNDLSFIHCNHRGYPCHINQIDISKIISCHSMSTYDFYHYTNILESNNYFL
jgi:hypothetical protein